MGWTSDADWDSKEKVIDHITEEYHTFKTLRHCVRGDVLWALHRSTRTNGETWRFIGCYLLGVSSGVWGYKDMDETMGPYYYTCPKSYIRDASPPINQVAADWRERVLEYHKVNKRRRKA